MKTPTKLASILIVPFLCVATPASAATIAQVTDISDLDLSNVLMAVSFRPDATDDTLEVNATTFLGVTGFTTPKMGVTNTSTFVTTINGNGGTDPVISGGSTFEGLQLDYIYNSIAVGDQAVSVAIPNGQYQVQLLLADGFIPLTTRIADITIEGKLTDDFSYAAAQLNDSTVGALLTENVVVADGSINIILTQDGGVGSPHLSGLIISSIPEPSTSVLAALGLVGLGFNRQRRHS